MDLSLAISYGYPAAQWSLSGNDYNTLVWHGPGKKPTLADLQAAWASMPPKPAELPPAAAYQIRAWMLRSGLSLAAVPGIIASVVPVSVPGGINRAEALMRWEYATIIPRDFPLVNAIGAVLNLSSEQIDAAWPSILAI